MKNITFNDSDSVILGRAIMAYAENAYQYAQKVQEDETANEESKKKAWDHYDEVIALEDRIAQYLDNQD